MRSPALLALLACLAACGGPEPLVNYLCACERGSYTTEVNTCAEDERTAHANGVETCSMPGCACDCARRPDEDVQCDDFNARWERT